ncbi:MAG TPA: FAD-binding oxidoreductase [Bryobacteraceae bacterium]|nr:FAD-binding oxidoreductase [Bryobacteraceae bacterium]
MADPALASIARTWESRFAGSLLTSSGPGFDAARQVWNAMIDRRPALIARCRTRHDVQNAIRLARAERLPISIRGGGHNITGSAVCHDGLMIDLSLMKDIRVDPDSKQAIAEPGVLWGEFDAATQAHGLATTGGQVSHTGIAGLTLGGGLGYLMGKHGAACDNVLSLDVVTADAELVTASEEQNADLFWAMRGAGANFGVVTSFRYKVHPLEQILGGMLLYPRERAGELIAFHREFLEQTPDELDTTIGFLNSPDGAPLVGIIAVYAGDVADGERVLRPLRQFGSPVADLVQPMPYTAVQRMVDDALPVGDRYYWKSNFVSQLTPGLATVLEQGANAMPSPYSMLLLFEMKGQIRRVPKDAMAFDHRDPHFEMSIVAHWTDAGADAENISWARQVWADAQPFVMPSSYANHMTADEGVERVRAAYGTEKFERLSVLKARYDPENLFRLNHNVPPRP